MNAWLYHTSQRELYAVFAFGDPNAKFHEIHVLILLYPFRARDVGYYLQQ